MAPASRSIATKRASALLRNWRAATWTYGSPGQPDAILLECLRVFQGDLTCCALGHPDGDECDFEALVPPALGLLGELYRDRHERPGAWALLKEPSRRRRRRNNGGMCTYKCHYHYEYFTTPIQAVPPPVC